MSKVNLIPVLIDKEYYQKINNEFMKLDVKNSEHWVRGSPCLKHISKVCGFTVNARLAHYVCSLWGDGDDLMQLKNPSDTFENGEYQEREHNFYKQELEWLA